LGEYLKTPLETPYWVNWMQTPNQTQGSQISEWGREIIRLGYHDVMKVRKVMKEVYGVEITGEVTVNEAICAIHAVDGCTDKWTTGAVDYECLKIVAPACYEVTNA